MESPTSGERPPSGRRSEYDDYHYLVGEIRSLRELRDADRRVLDAQQQQTAAWQRSIDERLTTVTTGLQAVKDKLAERQAIPNLSNLGIGGGIGIAITMLLWSYLKNQGLSFP